MSMVRSESLLVTITLWCKERGCECFI